MRHDGGERDAPADHDLRLHVGDWDAVLEFVSPLLGRHLVNMSRDAIQREDIAPE